MVQIPAQFLDAYPHQLSGGMKQRVVIAMALVLRPKLIIMDEPTTALDVVVQRLILQRVAELRKELGFSILFITHDLSLLVSFCGPNCHHVCRQDCGRSFRAGAL